MRILVMGLPGSGKTTLSGMLVKAFSDRGKTVLWLNADEIRQQENDWDFSNEGRIRQSERMRKLADQSDADIVIADFVAPLVTMRNIYQADYTIWMHTISSGRFEDTNKVFNAPLFTNCIVTDFDSSKWIDKILKDLA